MASMNAVREQACEVVVVGAGIAGLMAANTLADKADVVVLEAADRAGGRVESVRKDGYWLNMGTQFTEGTGTLIEALDRHGVVRGSLAGKKVALGLNGRLVDTANPIALMLRARMSMKDRIGLARVGARIIWAAVNLEMEPGGGRLRRALDRRMRRRLDRESASYFLRGVGSQVAHAMVRSWSGQWMGCDPGETAATQFVISVSIALADPAKVPNFSLPEGGNQTLTDILAGDLGDRLRLGSAVEAVEWRDGEVTVRYSDAEGPAVLRAKRAILAVPVDVATRIVTAMPQAHRDACADISYGRYVVVGYFTDEDGPQRWDDYYGVSTPQLSFQAMFNHAAALRGDGVRKPGGALVCFAGGGKADALFACTDAEIAERFGRDLLGLYPELEGKLGTPIVSRHHRVVPFWSAGKRVSLPVLRKPFGPVHLAGDYQLDIPSLADAAASGEAAAKAVLASL
ncbi:flavin monoamine oxidase family protein [Streptomyces sp. NPDC015661]|uniref:flavin monoamine oxidase family protein n=1 Tax=Streptomyces sp. NPDC015661 TaxID=3364961 RepID=UPI0036FEB561